VKSSSKRIVSVTNQFKKDSKLMVKRGKNLFKLQSIVEMLTIDITLPPKNKDHALIGNYVGYRECHLEPDWLLIYKKEDKTLILIRTGTHSDLCF
jgi:mRNA interferase YafQ